jgi:amino acid adenylation domain-containing protein
MNRDRPSLEVLKPAFAKGSEYHLAPLQEGMLCNYLLRGEGVDVQQLVMTLREPLELPLLARAWQAVTDRHQALRVSFRWHGLDRPVQAFRDSLAIGIEESDLRNIDQCEQRARLSAYLAADRQKGFDLSNPPLSRLTCFQTAKEEYELIWSFHHIMIDGRSIRIVLEEVFRTYDALASGSSCELSRPHPYSAFLEWLERRDQRGAESYWRETLGGFSSPTKLAVDRGSYGHAGEVSPGLPSQSISEIRFSEAQTSGLRALATRHGVSVNTILQGAWALLLSRYSGEDDVVFGATRAARHSTVPHAESMVGYFINTLPVRARVAPDVMVADWLKDLRRQHLAVREFEHTPLARIRGWSVVPGTLPLFETLLVFENYELQRALQARGGNWRRRSVHLHGQTGIPVTVAGFLGTELTVRICCDGRHFDGPTAQRLAGHLRTLVEEMVQGTSRRLSDLNMLTATERRQILWGWNNTAADYPRDRLIHELVEEQGGKTPECIALADESRDISYRKLIAQAETVAHALRRIGPSPQGPIGLWGRSGVDTVTAMLGILKAGFAYVPLPVSAPSARIKAIVDDAGIACVVACDDAHWPADLENIHVLSFARLIRDPRPGGAESALPNVPRSDAVACILYTSGTTGRPKGVCVRHQSFINLMTHRTEAQFLPGDFRVAPLLAPMHFDASLVQILSPLITGGTLVVARTPDELARSRWYSKLTAITGASALVADLARRHGIPESVRVVGVGAEPVSAELLDHMVKTRSIERFLNLYGMTECACYSTVAVLFDRRTADPDQWETASRPERLNEIGRPIANTQVYVLDRDGHPLPVGIPGELYIGGDGLARGYLNRPDATAERFIQSPFAPDHILYRTGDRVRWSAEGTLEFLGRLDEQVKLRGCRIELGEVEGAVASHPAVAQCAVILHQQSPTNGKLVAYWVPRQSEHVGARSLREHVAVRLPDYMVPSIFMILDRLPLTPSGKVDRHSLPAPEQHRLDSEQLPLGPRDSIEDRLATIWGQVLSLAPSSIRDCFFDLGGDSLAAIRLFDRMEAEFGRRLSPTLIFRASTVEQLAVELRDAPLQSTNTALVPIRVGDTSPFFFLPGGGDPGMVALKLALHLDPRQTVFTFDFDRPFRESLDSPEIVPLAAALLHQLQSVQPRGPYLLGGYSLGGIVAFEMARQLHALGERVALLVLIDTYGPDYPRRATRWEMEWQHWQRMRGLSPSGKLRDLAHRLRNRWRRATSRWKVRALQDASADYATTGRAVPRRTLAHASWSYLAVRPTYLGPLVLLRAIEQPHSLGDRFDDPENGWRTLVRGGIRVFPIPAAHLTMFQEPGIHAVADVLQSCLRHETLDRSCESPDLATRPTGDLERRGRGTIAEGVNAADALFESEPSGL